MICIDSPASASRPTMQTW